MSRPNSTNHAVQGRKPGIAPNIVAAFSVHSTKCRLNGRSGLTRAVRDGRPDSRSEMSAHPPGDPGERDTPRRITKTTTSRAPIPVRRNRPHPFVHPVLVHRFLRAGLPNATSSKSSSYREFRNTVARELSRACRAWLTDHTGSVLAFLTSHVPE